MQTDKREWQVVVRRIGNHGEMITVGWGKDEAEAKEISTKNPGSMIIKPNPYK